MDTGLIERGEAASLPPRGKACDAAVAAAAIETLALQRHGQASRDPWESLVGFRLGGTLALDWEFELDGIEGHINVKTATERHRAFVTVDGGPARTLVATPTSGGRLLVAVDGQAVVWDHAADRARHFLAADSDTFAAGLVEQVPEITTLASEGAIEAPMPGTVLDVRVAVGDVVSADQVLVVIESMKMELTITAPADAWVAEVGVAPGDGVKQGQTLVVMEATT